MDPDLQGPIAKARAKFAGQSEQYVRALWRALEFVIGGNEPQAEFTPDAMKRCEE